MYYDYRTEIKEDIRNYLADHLPTDRNELLEQFANRENLQEELYDMLWVEDSVTGNASGSYTFNSYTAGEYLARNFELLAEALREFGCNVDVLEEGTEWCDVTIRCYLLGECLDEVLTDIENDIEDTED